jgi:hypothetical protein
MLYADDPLPIETTEGLDGKYEDARLSELVEYLTNAELTQCAHRNRPLRHDGRIVVTLSSGTVDFLPITTEITGLPILKDKEKLQQEQERLRKAERVLIEQGKKITVRAMLETLGSPGIKREKVLQYLKSKGGG